MTEVSTEYLSTLGLRVLRGHGFSDASGQPLARMIVIGEALERAYWPGMDATGRCVQLNGDPDCYRIVGVVADPREKLVGDQPRHLVYAPIGALGSASRTLIVRTQVSPSSIERAVRHAMQSSAGDLPFIDVQPLDHLLRPQLRAWRVGTLILGTFGSLAALITGVGLYGAVRVVSASRSHEFGVRSALGAARPALMALLLRFFGLAIAVGTCTGILLWAIMSRRLGPLLFDTSPLDVGIVGGATLVVLLIGVAACAAPAIRASRADPLAALRAG